MSTASQAKQRRKTSDDRRTRNYVAVTVGQIRTGGVVTGMNLKTYQRIDDADPNSIIVTIFGDDDGVTRGWYIAPLATLNGIPFMWNTSPADNLLASVAIIRALELSKELGCQVCIVDPAGLWNGVL